MINTSEHSCLLRDQNETNSSVLHIHVSVCLSLRLTQREGLHIFTSQHIGAQALSEMCLRLCQYRRHPRALPLAPSVNDHMKSAVLVQTWCQLTGVCTPSASAQQVRTSGRHGKRQAEEVSTTNSLKHTTDIKDDPQRKNVGKRRNGRRKGNKDREKVTEGGDIQRRARMHVSLIVQHFIYDGFVLNLKRHLNGFNIHTGRQIQDLTHVLFIYILTHTHT